MNLTALLAGDPDSRLTPVTENHKTAPQPQPVAVDAILSENVPLLPEGDTGHYLLPEARKTSGETRQLSFDLLTGSGWEPFGEGIDENKED